MPRATPIIEELGRIFREEPDILEAHLSSTASLLAALRDGITRDELGIIFTVPSVAQKQELASTETDQQVLAESEEHFILAQHKLGVSVNSVHPLINEARQALAGARRGYERARRGEDANLFAAAAETLLSVTRALLMVNADHGSAWNARKEVVSGSVFSTVRDEIKLLDLIFTKHAKSSNAWAHRRWCWKNDERLGRRQQSAGRRWRPLDVQAELEVCARVADLYPKNYYAWTQRSWVVLRTVGKATAIEPGVQGAATERNDAHALLQREVSFVNRWLKSHVSDHSALNHRKNIVSALAAMSSETERAGLGFVDKELEVISELIRDYPGHESLWCYRRFICQTFLLLLHRSGEEETKYRDQVNAAKNHAATATGPSLVDEDLASGSMPTEKVDTNLDGNENVVCAEWSTWIGAVQNFCERHLRDSRLGEEESSSEEDEEEYAVEAVSRADCRGIPEMVPLLTQTGGEITNFVAQEVRFALQCVRNKDAWQYQRQQAHALAHVAFVTYAADRMARNGHGSRCGAQHEALGQVERGRPARGAIEALRDEGEIKDVDCCANSCEITGSPRLIFPLAQSRSDYSADDRGTGSAGVHVGMSAVCLEGLRALNRVVSMMPLRCQDRASKDPSSVRGIWSPYRLVSR